MEESLFNWAKRNVTGRCLKFSYQNADGVAKELLIKVTKVELGQTNQPVPVFIRGIGLSNLGEDNKFQITQTPKSLPGVSIAKKEDCVFIDESEFIELFDKCYLSELNKLKSIKSLVYNNKK